MPWRKWGTPGSVTVMDGAGPEPGPLGPATPPSRRGEPRSWARFPSGLPSTGWPMEVVMVVWVDVCPAEVLEEEWGGDMVEELDEKEVEKEDSVLFEEEVDMESPGAVRKTGKK